MAITHLTTHVADADALFIDQYKEKARLSALLAAFTARCQEAEDALFEIYLGDLIDSASNAQLDVIGKLVGQPRVGDTDAAYRLHIRTRIAANTSDGNTKDVVVVAALALQQAFNYEEYYPRSFVVEVTDPLPSLTNFIMRIISLAKPAGVGWSLHYSPDTPKANWFTFAEGSIEQDSPNGWSDTLETNPGGLMIAALSS